MLNQSDLRHRVVIRRYVEVPGADRPRLSDLLGELVALDPEWLEVRTDAGEVVRVAATTVTAAKRIPPRPVRYSEMAALELIADQAWPAAEVEHLGDWLLRAAEGWTNRANSVLPIGNPGHPLDEAIAIARQWYAQRGLTAMVTVPLPLRRDVADLLADWTSYPLVLVQTAELAPLAQGDTRADLHLTPTPGWLAAIEKRRTTLPAAAAHVLTAPPQVRFAEIADSDGATVATARGVVVDTWMHLGLVGVVEQARRQGLARRVSASLAQWALDAGATRAVLQVEERNTAAVALYASMGFTTHHRYVTYRAP